MAGRLAQMGERFPYKEEVGGSIPSTPTTPVSPGQRRYDWGLVSLTVTLATLIGSLGSYAVNAVRSIGVSRAIHGSFFGWCW